MQRWRWTHIPDERIKEILGAAADAQDRLGDPVLVWSDLLCRLDEYDQAATVRFTPARSGDAVLIDGTLLEFTEATGWTARRRGEWDQP